MHQSTMDGTHTDGIDLMPKHDQKTVQGQADALLWAMNDMLPWHVPSPRAGTYLFRSAEEMTVIWSDHGGDVTKVSHVDFSTRMVVAVFEDAGTYQTIHVVGHVIPKDGRIWVIIAQRTAIWEMINPCSVISIPRYDGDTVFLNAGSPEADAILAGVKT